jgi:exosome complex component RRP46
MSTALNAAYLALIDAGIPLNGTLASISCMVDSNGHVLLDPTKFELMNAQSTHEIAMDSQGQIFYIDSVGTFKLNEVFCLMIHDNLSWIRFKNCVH